MDKTLATEADTAIGQLPEKDQGYIRQLVANNIKKITNKHNSLKGKRHTNRIKREHVEWNTIKSLKHKINQNQLITTKADEGNTLVTLHKDDYNNTIEEFITKNNFTKLPYDITTKQQQNIRNRLNKCDNVINTNNKRMYINMIPRAPQIHGTIKLHKHDRPIRQIANSKESPGYKIGKYLKAILNKTLTLPNSFNVQKSYSLA
jgi:hypothetical protein